MNQFKRRGSEDYSEGFKCSDAYNMTMENGSITKNDDDTITVINKYGEEIGKPCDYIVMTPYGPHVVRGVIFNYLFEI